MQKSSYSSMYNYDFCWVDLFGYHEIDLTHSRLVNPQLFFNQYINVINSFLPMRKIAFLHV